MLHHYQSDFKHSNCFKTSKMKCFLGSHCIKDVDTLFQSHKTYEACA